MVLELFREAFVMEGEHFHREDGGILSPVQADRGDRDARRVDAQSFMMASRNSPMAAAAPMRAARMTPIDWTMIGTSSTLPAAGPEYHPQARPTTRPPIRRPTPIFRLFPLPK